MYNDIVIILFCVFAVYGVYALVREVAVLLFRKSRAIAAARITSEMDADARNDAIRNAEQFAQQCVRVDKAPVLLCDDPIDADLAAYGYAIYIRQTDTEETCRQK